MKFLRVLLGSCVFLLILFITSLSATVYKGMSSIYYTNKNTVFHNNDSAVGEVLLRGGFTILPDATGTFSIATPVYGPIDLRSTGTLKLGTDLILDSTLTITKGGNIWGNRHTIFLTGDLTFTTTLNFINNTIIDGQGHNLILGPYAQMIVDNRTTVTFKNVTIKNTINATSIPAISCRSLNSAICLDNVTFGLNDNLTFTSGKIFFRNDVKFTGNSKFSYRSTLTSYIAEHSNVIFDPNTTFEYFPASINNNLIQMANKTSSIIFNNSSLLTTRTGIRLTKGSVYFDNKVTLSSTDHTLSATVPVPSGAGIPSAYSRASYGAAWSPNGNYVALGNTGSVSDIYSFNGSSLSWITSTPSSKSTTSIAWTGEGADDYLALGNNGAKSDIYTFDGSLLSLAAQTPTSKNTFSIAWSPAGRRVAVGNYGEVSDIYFFTTISLVIEAQTPTPKNTLSIAWSPDGNYVALGNDGQASEIYGYFLPPSYTFSLITQTTSADRVYAIAWSPDGKYLAMANNNSPATCKIYSFDGTSLSFVDQTAPLTSTPYKVAWSPDGLCLAVGDGDLYKIYSFSDNTLSLLYQGFSSVPVALSMAWRYDSNYLVVGHSTGFARVYPIAHTFDTSPQGFRNGITFGDSALGSAYDLDVHSLAAARINLYGNLWHDSLNSWVFDSRDSYLSLNRYDSKFKITEADSMNNWKEQHIIKSSQDNSLFLQDNQIWETNTDYNLAPEETFEFMNDLIIPDNQLVKLSSNAVIDGQGHNLVLGKYAQLLVDGGITVTFKNMTIKNTLNTISCPPIRCMDWYSKACFDNTTLSFNDDFAFRNGQIFVCNDVNITGTSKFSYRSVCPSYIAQHSNLIFDPNTTFEFYPSTTDNTLIQMADKTSAIMFDGSTLQTTHTGIRLTKGSLYFDNKVTLSSADNTACYGFGTHISPNYDYAVYDEAWSPDGRYLAVGGDEYKGLFL